MFWLTGLIVAALAHTAPFPFLLDTTDRTLWRMPATDPPTIYLTFDDGPNPTATPELLDVLRRHEVKGTFFVSADKLKTFDGGTHFGAASEIELGERFAAGMAKALGAR